MACGRLAFLVPMMSANSLLTFITLIKAAGAVFFFPSLLFFELFFLIILLLFFLITLLLFFPMVFFVDFDTLRLAMADKDENQLIVFLNHGSKLQRACLTINVMSTNAPM